MTKIVTEKRCTRCGETKPISDFYRNKSSKGGVSSECKQCTLERAKAYRATHSEEKREYQKAYRATHQERKREYAKAYYAAHQEELREYAKSHRAAHPRQGKVYRAAHREEIREGNRNSKLKKKYRITAADFDIMLSQQGGRCAICGTDQPGGRYGVFYVDHDHVSGRIRGLLCNNCNSGIGYMQDNPDLLRAASRYIAGITE
jgi:hypothetical protein